MTCEVSRHIIFVCLLQKDAIKIWLKERDKAEHVIFFKYTGKQSRYEKSEQFYEAISPVTGDDAYVKAYTIRDENQTR